MDAADPLDRGQDLEETSGIIVEVDADFDPDIDDRADSRSLRHQETRQAERSLRRAFLVTLLLHMAVGLAPSLLQRQASEPERFLGFAGAPARRSLSLPAERLAELDVPARRAPTTPIHLLRVAPRAAEETRPSESPGAAHRTPRADAVVHLPAASESRPPGSALDGAEPPRFVLREDWSSVSAGRPESRTNEFRIVELVRPEYPDLSIQRDEEGLVKLEAKVSVGGRVMDVLVVESSGSPDLEVASILALERWKFAPYYEAGEPIPFTVVVPFRFRLLR